MQVPKPVRMGYEGKQAGAQASLGDDLWDLHAAAVRLLDFCTGRTLRDYEQMDVLRAAVSMMLSVMDDAACRIELQSAETAERLTGLSALHKVVRELEGSDAGEALWRFIEGGVPGLVASVAEELQRWHEG